MIVPDATSQLSLRSSDRCLNGDNFLVKDFLEAGRFSGNYLSITCMECAKKDLWVCFTGGIQYPADRSAALPHFHESTLSHE